MAQGDGTCGASGTGRGPTDPLTRVLDGLGPVAGANVQEVAEHTRAAADVDRLARALRTIGDEFAGGSAEEQPVAGEEPATGGVVRRLRWPGRSRARWVVAAAAGLAATTALSLLVLTGGQGDEPIRSARESAGPAGGAKAASGADAADSARAPVPGDAAASGAGVAPGGAAGAAPPGVAPGGSTGGSAGTSAGASAGSATGGAATKGGATKGGAAGGAATKGGAAGGAATKGGAAGPSQRERRLACARLIAVAEVVDVAPAGRADRVRVSLDLVERVAPSGGPDRVSLVVAGPRMRNPGPDERFAEGQRRLFVVPAGRDTAVRAFAGADIGPARERIERILARVDGIDCP